jgi:hypothetical protein
MTYFGWNGYEDMLNSFKHYNDTEYKLMDPIPQEHEVLFASYGGRSYEGHAYVLFLHDGSLWEVEGSHCSCNGLEEQWRPNITTWGAQRLKERARPDGWGGWLYDHEMAAQDAFFELVAQNS